MTYLTTLRCFVGTCPTEHLSEVVIPKIGQSKVDVLKRQSQDIANIILSDRDMTDVDIKTQLYILPAHIKLNFLFIESS